MLDFQGYLASYTRSDAAVLVRFVSGETNPTPDDLPVLKVEVSVESGSTEVIDAIARLTEEEAWLYISHSPGEALQIESEYRQEFVLVGSTLKVEQVAYEAADLQRLAQQSYERLNKQQLAIKAQSARIARIRELLQEQYSRIEVKAAGHAIGTTARTLYEQHLSFIDRLRNETEA